jgi:hypothetical protein
MTRRRTVRFGLLLLAVVLVAGLVAPFIRADRFRGRIERGLSAALGRKVEITKGVRPTLFAGPGFTAEDVVIHEEPVFGAEPLAHVLELEARVSIPALLTGRLEFSHLELNEPSVNLVRAPQRGWNLIQLAARAGNPPASGSRSHALPTVSLRSGRLWFKLGETKSAFYLLNADLDVNPRSGGRDGFDIRFSAEPARTDRPARGFATLTGSGRWRQPAAAEPALDLDLQLERTALDELVRLFRGHHSGVHGYLTSRARVSGPVSALKVTGRMQVGDVHRWDLMPTGGDWTFRYAGQVNWRAESAAFDISDRQNAGLPLSAAINIERFLSEPSLSAELKTAGLPAANVVQLVRHIGATLPANLEVDGVLEGAARYDPVAGWTGAFSLGPSKLRLGNERSMVSEATQIALSGPNVNFGPAKVSGEEGQSAVLQLSYSIADKALDMTVTAQALSVAEMKAGAGRLFAVGTVPLADSLERGRWAGAIRYRSAGDEPGAWSGQFELRDVMAAVPGMAEPVRLRSATVDLDGERAVLRRIRARAGTIDLFGEYRYDPALPRPHRFHLTVPELDAAEVERLFLPTLRRDPGLLARTLSWRTAPPPAWLQTRGAEGTVRVGALRGGPLEVRALRASVVWDGAQITITGRNGRLNGGLLEAAAALDISGAAPRYRIDGTLRGAAWHEGEVDLEGVFETRGTETAWLRNLKANGTFHARSIDVLPENPIRVASGNFRFQVADSGPEIHLAPMQAALGGETYSGEAATLGDGNIRVDLASAKRSVRFEGPLSPLRLDTAVAKP